MFAFLLGFARWLDFVDLWVAEVHTAQWFWLWVLFAHRGLVQHDDTPLLIHDDPDCPPIWSAFYPGWAIANFALLVWQEDTPDSGGAAIMGVPLASPRFAFVGVPEQAHPDKGKTR